MSELNAKQLAALDRIQEKPQLQPFFFRKLKGLIWFDEIERRGFFSPHLQPEVVETEEGRFRLPTWPVLEYLDKSAPELESLV